MKNNYKKHVFVCVNKRKATNKKSCGNIGIPLKIKLKKSIVEKKINNEIRINSSGCLGKCNLGPCVVVYPQSQWKFNVKLEDNEKIINELITK